MRGTIPDSFRSGKTLEPLLKNCPVDPKWPKMALLNDPKKNFEKTFFVQNRSIRKNNAIKPENETFYFWSPKSGYLRPRLKSFFDDFSRNFFLPKIAQNRSIREKNGLKPKFDISIFKILKGCHLVQT